MVWSGFVWKRMCVLSICQDLNVVTIRACGQASWERQPSYSQALLNGTICNSMSIPILFIVHCGVLLCMLQRPCITEIFVHVNLFFLPYGNSAWVRFRSLIKNWILKCRGYVMIKGRQYVVTLALELRHCGSERCFFAWLMFCQVFCTYNASVSSPECYGLDACNLTTVSGKMHSHVWCPLAAWRSDVSMMMMMRSLAVAQIGIWREYVAVFRLILTDLICIVEKF
jgi:hypothetical protein